MILYIVRHGESELNAKKIHQNATIPLSPLGKNQAVAISQRLSNILIDTIIASPFERAKMTAEIIGEKLSLPIEYSEIFVEIKRPSEIEGKGVDEPEVLAIKNKIRENSHDPEWRYSDEETFFDLKSRVLQGIEDIQKRDAENIVLVTHGEFLRMLVFVLALQENATPENYLYFRPFLEVSNTGLTILKYTKDKWHLASWNDHSHL